MGHSFIWAAFLVFSLWNFRLFYCVKGFERGYLGLYKGVAMASVICFDTSGNSIVPFFNQNIFEKELDLYLEANIAPYVNDYSYRLSWGRVQPYPSESSSRNKVTVDFDFSLMFVGDFRRQLVFTIRESIYE